MSWSDESGQDLVHFFEEGRGKGRLAGSRSSSSELDRDAHTSGVLKSSMKRTNSTSVQGGGGLEGLGRMNDSLSMALAGASPSDRGEFGDTVSSLPKHGALTGNYSPSAQYFSKGGAAPSGGPALSAAAKANGGISPQWGWYVSTTPPVAAVYERDAKGAKGEGGGIGAAVKSAEAARS
jgi:hypothetical protein